MLIALALGPWSAAGYVFSCLWISNFVNPYGKGEDMMYLAIDSVGMSLIVLLFPFIFAWQGSLLIPAMFYFYVFRAGFYIATVPFLKMATWNTSIFLTLMGFFLAITQAYVILHLIAPLVFDAFSIGHWDFGTLPLFNPIR